MKKTLLLSVIASTMIMAGGDIAPVEPEVEAPIAETSGWDFSGQAVLYYQTVDSTASDVYAETDLFSQEGSVADAGIQLRAVNKDLFAGVGVGVEVSGLSTLNLENSVVSGVMQGTGSGDIDDMTDGGWISQMYLTYSVDNTSFKAGRQELPKALSPFAFSEGWNVFKNTFDAVLAVNTDIENTTLVYAWVYGGNSSVGNVTDFNDFNDNDGIHMLTAQNKSFSNLTLTGSWYYAPDLVSNTLGVASGDTNILWGDAKYNADSFYVSLQGGAVWLDTNGAEDTGAFGAKIGGKVGMFDLSLAYSNVNNSAVGVFNTGGVKTPLYTQMILNQDFIKIDSDTFVARVGVKALGGKLGLAYNYSDYGLATNSVNYYLGSNRFAGDDEGTYQELDLTYKTKVFNDTTTVFAGYIYRTLDVDSAYWAPIDEYDQNVLRFWARYNF
ncbi:hypothetical protein ACM66Z_01325 [Sulfurovum sp. ST-21]|uniref:Porin n=1 Tax=Sulfurovum indicum TaxID=2779528 RepID=A0A7M1S463_9BACT|nr:hypothetical protein [Sulfurovum indicum]QOR62148.1 hypothetical protein IMZ28_01315 [Sulfurovum indicum]